MLEQKQDRKMELMQIIKERNSGSGRIPEFLVEKDEEGRFILFFQNKLGPAISLDNWTAVTVSPRCFVNMVITSKNMLDQMTGKE